MDATACEAGVRLRNLTPHPVVLFLRNGTTLTLTPAGPTVRSAIAREQVATLPVAGTGVPVYETRLLPETTPLPAPEPGVWLVVSRTVAETHPDRLDLLFPDDLVRDGDGQVIGCRALARLAR